MKKTEKAMSGVKLIEKRSRKALMDLLGFEETSDRIAKANRVQWYEHALRKVNDDVQRKVLGFEIVGRREHG